MKDETLTNLIAIIAIVILLISSIQGCQTMMTKELAIKAGLEQRVEMVGDHSQVIWAKPIN